MNAATLFIATGIIALLACIALLDRSIAGAIGVIASILFIIGATSLRSALGSMLTSDESSPASPSDVIVFKNAAAQESKAAEVHVPTASVPSKNWKKELPSDTKATSKTPAQPAWTSTIEWEQWVGQKLMQKVGIIIVLIGMIVLLKYSFDNRWIDELGRLGLAALAGIGMLGAGEYFRKKYASWANGFTGGGLILLYFTVWAAHVFYAAPLAERGLVITSTMALVLYAAITLVSALAAIRYSSQTIAWFALVGGYLTPMLIDTPQPNYGGLALYLAVLTGGLLVLAWHKKWSIISLVSFILTQLYLFGLIYLANDYPGISDSQQIVIAVGFFLLFSLLPIVSQFRLKEKATDLDITLIACNGLAVFLPVVDALGGWQSEYTTLVSLALAAVYVCLAAMALSLRRDDSNLVNTYLTAGIGLIALALYRQMGVEWFAAGFAPYSVLLVFTASRIKRSVPLITGSIIMSLALLGLFINLPIFNATAETIWRPFTSSWSIMSYITVASLVGWMKLSENLPPDLQKTNALIRTIGSAAVALIAFAAVTFETTHLHFFVSFKLSFAYLVFTAACIALFYFTKEIVWFVAAFVVQMLVLFFTFAGGPSNLSFQNSILHSGGILEPTAIVHLWSIISILSVALLVALLFVTKKTPVAKVRNSQTSELIAAIILGQVWLHGTVEINNLSTVLLWTSEMFQRVLSGWWIVFALALIAMRKYPKVKVVGIALLLLPFAKDLMLLIDGSGTFYETALWTLLPLGLATTGANMKDKQLVQAGVFMLGGTTGVDMLTHLGWHQVSLVRSVWWAFIGLLSLMAGFSQREQLLRRIAIGIFAGATVKLLIFDFSVLSTPVRIIASIATGLLMIGGSYLYQRESSRLEK